MTKTNNVVPMGNNQLATKTDFKQDILASDIIIPAVYLMQSGSGPVKLRKSHQSGEIREGDIIRATTLEKLGDDKKGVNIIPLRFQNTWVESECTGNANGKKLFSYRGVVGRNAGNERLPFTFYRDVQKGIERNENFTGATEWTRMKVISVYALVQEDVEAYNAEVKKALENGEMPDINKSLRPVCIPFRMSSYKAGQRVVDFFASYEDFRQSNPNLKSYGFTMPLTCKRVEGKPGQGSYMVYEVGNSKGIKDADLLKTAETWYNRLCSSSVKVDESGMEEADDSRTAEQSQF